MAQTRADEKPRAHGRRLPRAKRLPAIKKKANYEEYGGAPLLGVNGICIIAPRLQHAARDQKRAPRRGRIH